MLDNTTHALSLALGVLAKKHQIIASNIANSKVKSYKAQSINSKNLFEKIFYNIQTNTIKYPKDLNKKIKIATTNTRNLTDLKDQIQELSKTNIDYSRMIKAYSTANNLIDTVLGK